MFALRCPICRAIDWYRDGVVISELETDRVAGRRAEPAIAGPTATLWSCMQCGHELLTWTGLAKSLDELERSAVREAAPIELKATG